MAAPRKTKKVIGKDDLKRLMKEKVNAAKASSKRIDSPLAKYNTLGNLSCVLCHIPIKSDLLWNSHLQSRSHKENIAKLKDEKIKKEHSFVRPASPTDSKKRKYRDEELLAISKQHTGDNDQGLPSDFFDANKTSATIKPKKPRSILVTSATYKQQSTGGAPSSVGHHSVTYQAETSIAGSRAPQPSSDAGSRDTAPSAVVTTDSSQTGLPSDFFDADVVPSTSTDGATGADTLDAPVVMSEQLPEGFFDDPKMDAKVRKVEFVDKMDEEWAMFQRAMKEESSVSEAILAEDDEEANEERNLAEVEEQLQKWSKIEQLVKKKEEVVAQEKEATDSSGDDDNDADEQALDELLDWRSKQAWK